MNPGDLASFRRAPIWSPFEVVGYSDQRKIYLILEERYDEWKILGGDGLIGWIGKEHLAEVMDETR